MSLCLCNNFEEQSTKTRKPTEKTILTLNPCNASFFTLIIWLCRLQYAIIRTKTTRDSLQQQQKHFEITMLSYIIQVLFSLYIYLVTSYIK